MWQGGRGRGGGGAVCAVREVEERGCSEEGEWRLGETADGVHGRELRCRCPGAGGFLGRLEWVLRRVRLLEEEGGDGEDGDCGHAACEGELWLSMEFKEWA